MPDREKVLKEFDYLIEHFYPACTSDSYYLSVMETVRELLKDKPEHDLSFIVIDTKTGKEADTYNIALHEDWAKHLCYCDMDGWAIQDDGSLLLLDECGRYAYADRERFKVEWDA